MRALPLPLPLPRTARARRDHPALATPAGAVTYAELAARADALALRLAGLGVEPGDRVAVRLPSGADFAALAHAVARLGAILVPLHPRLSEPEIAWQLDDAAPRVVVAGDPAPDRGGAAESTADAVAEGGFESTRLTPAKTTIVTPDALARLDPAAPAVLAESLAPEHPHTLVYTSGTTGRPKGAVLTWGNVVASALGSALRIGADPADRWLVPLPLAHVGGLSVLWRSALAGTTVVVMDRFDAGPVARLLADDRPPVTVVSLVPTMLVRLLDAWGDRPAPAALRAVLVGGGPLAPDLVERAVDLGFPVAATYGLTEAASQVATAWPGTRPVDGAVGAPPLAFTEVRVVDAAGEPLPAGAVGTIRVRGPTVMAGYWNDPAATAAVLAGGWLHTGDVGRLDDAGSLVLAGRRSDLIVTGGENVYPAEVEAVLDAHPRVAESCVVGVPDPVWGEVVVAVVVAPDRGARPHPEDRDDAAILDFARARLAGFKVPRRVIRVHALPRTATGKARREAVRALAEENPAAHDA